MIDYDAIARWVYDTCRLFGCLPETAAEISGMFVRTLRDERQRKGL